MAIEPTSAGRPVAQPMRGGKAVTQNSTAFLLSKLQSLHETNPHPNVLDVAGGHGSSTMMLAQAIPGCTITAIDIDPSVFERARAFCSAGGVEEVSFHEADARDLPFPDATFDVVFCHQLLVHVPRPWEVIREMARVAKPGGIIAAREGDYETEAVWPKPEGIRKMHQLVAGSIAAKGGDPAGGRKLLEWTLKAGFKREQIALSYSHWLFQNEAERRAWVEQVTSILRDNNNWLPKMGIAKELASAEDLEEIAQGWEEWGRDESAHQVMLNAEVIIENQV